ncbi:MAG: DUF4389 domain-containing protein [Actinomycetota bacterium]|nr:DUF4389 domain-containing protein [Actinomycetota bacterium]
MIDAPLDRPIRLVIRDDDLRRSRLTVLFRLVLALPHFVWLTLWGTAASIASFVLWLAVLIEGKAPESLHDFVAGYLRYATQLGAYVVLAADPYPGFRGRPGYPVDVEIDPPSPQSRLSGLIRLVLALPAILLAAALGAGFTWGASGGLYVLFFALVTSSGVAGVAAVLAWFAILALGRAPRGLRDLTAYALGYGAQTGAYALLLTGRYPSSDPVLAESFSELPEHPVRVVLTDELERPRLMVAFRLLLAIPHLVWLLLWTVATFAAAVVAWVAALATGRIPTRLHRFLAAYVRYVLNLLSFVHLVGRKFPGFTGRAGSYGIDLEIPPPTAQNRWKTLLRLFLALPALLLGSALGGVLFVVALLGWFYAIVAGRMPEGLRNLGVSCLRYGAQLDSYVLLLTDRYPYAAPVLRPRRAEPEEWVIPPSG